MVWTRLTLPAPNKLRIFLLAVLATLLALFFLHGSWQDSAGFKSFLENDKPSSMKETDPLVSSSRVSKPTKPAVVAAARATEDVSWMEHLSDEYGLQPLLNSHHLTSCQV